MTSAPFRKYHGLGNDFVLFDGLGDSLPEAQLAHPALARRLCDRHRGIGADGLLLVLPPSSTLADARMRIINADGSEPEMCGNGIRCVGKALHDHGRGLRGRESLRIETGAGMLDITLRSGEDGLAATATVDMGRPSFAPADLPLDAPEPWIDRLLQVGASCHRWTGVSMGNPHFVTFVSDAHGDLLDLGRTLGPVLETHELFPNRTNVELARMRGDEVDVVVWERGCGITQACGTGACAVAAAAVETGRHPAGRALPVNVPGGTLRITVGADGAGVRMEGPAVEVYRGQIAL